MRFVYTPNYIYKINYKLDNSEVDWKAVFKQIAMITGGAELNLNVIDLLLIPSLEVCHVEPGVRYMNLYETILCTLHAIQIMVRS